MTVIVAEERVDSGFHGSSRATWRDGVSCNQTKWTDGEEAHGGYEGEKKTELENSTQNQTSC